jgi:outer membrane protein TolC
MHGGSICAQQKNIEYYLEALKSNHPATMDFENQAKLSELDNMKIKAESKLPAVFATANIMKAPLINGVGYDEAITNGALYSTLINAEESILNPVYKFETKKNILQASHLRFQGKLSSREIEKQVIDQYIQCYTGQLLLSSAKDLRVLMQEQFNMGNVLAKSGILKASDILLLEIEMGNEDLKITELQLQFSKNLSDLNSLCGLTDTLEANLSSIDLSIAPNDSTGINFNYQFTIDSLMAENNLAISQQKYKPQLSAFANLGINAVDPANIPSNLGFSAGIDFKVNIYDGKQKKINWQQTQIQLENIDNYKRYFTSQRMQSRQNLLKQVEFVKKEMKIAEEQLDKYKSLLNIYRKGIANGDISVIDYLTVVNTYRKTNDDYINFNQQIQTNINAYNYWNW